MNFRRSVITAELWRREIARLAKIAIFALMEKRPLMGKFSKLCSESFHHDTD